MLASGSQTQRFRRLRAKTLKPRAHPLAVDQLFRDLLSIHAFEIGIGGVGSIKGVERHLQSAGLFRRIHMRFFGHVKHPCLH